MKLNRIAVIGAIALSLAAAPAARAQYTANFHTPPTFKPTPSAV